MEKQEIEDAKTIQILAIMSMALICILSPFTLVIAIVSLIMAQKRLNLAKATDIVYSNINQLYNAKTIAIISIIINIIWLIIMLFIILSLFLSFKMFEAFLDGWV
jgi:hypothetical protein